MTWKKQQPHIQTKNQSGNIRILNFSNSLLKQVKLLLFKNKLEQSQMQ